MGFRNGAYARIWSVEKGQGNYYVADMSTSRKGQDGEYQKDWSNKFVRLIGGAAEKASSLNVPCTVRIGDCDVTNYYDKAKETMYTNYAIFSFMEDDNNTGAEKKSSTKKSTKSAKKLDDTNFVDVPDDENGELPFV